MLAGLIEEDNVIKYVFMPKLKVFLFLIAGCFACSTSVKKMTDSNGNILQIDFQNFFDRDSVTLAINNCVILEDYLITSSKIDGFTGLSIKIGRQDRGKAVVSYLNKKIICNHFTGEISMSVTLNKKRLRYVIDLTKGMYVGLSKLGNDELSFVQTDKAFVYD